MLILSQRSLRLSSIFFYSFSFILLFSSQFHHSIFQLTYPFFYLSYSAIGSFQNIFNFNNCVIYLCFLIISSMSLVIVLTVLNASCIFSILFSSLWSIFTIIIMNSLSGRLLISSLFTWSCEFQPYTFICVVFLCLFIFFLFVCFFKLLHSQALGLYYFFLLMFCPWREMLAAWFVLISCWG